MTSTGTCTGRSNRKTNPLAGERIGEAKNPGPPHHGRSGGTPTGGLPPGQASRIWNHERQSEGTKPEGESEDRTLDGTQDHNHGEEASGSGLGPAGRDRNFECNKTDLRNPDRKAKGGRAPTHDEVAQSEPEAGSVSGAAQHRASQARKPRTPGEDSKRMEDTQEMFSAPIGQWQGHDQREGHDYQMGSEGSKRNPSRRGQQTWEWQPGHHVPTQEEEANQGRPQEEGPEPEQEEEEDFEEMIQELGRERALQAYLFNGCCQNCREMASGRAEQHHQGQRGCRAIGLRQGATSQGQAFL